MKYQNEHKEKLDIRAIKLNNRFTFLFIIDNNDYVNSGVVVSDYCSGYSHGWGENSGYSDALELARKFFVVYNGGNTLHGLNYIIAFFHRHRSQLNKPFAKDKYTNADYLLDNLEKTLNYCKIIGVSKQVLYRNFPELQDIENEAKAAIENKISDIININPKKTSYVYFAKSNDIYKIGVSDNPKSRLDNLRTGSAIPIEIEYVIPSNNPRDIETTLHRRFANKNVHREWFNISDDEINQLKLEYKILEWREISDIF